MFAQKCENTAYLKKRLWFGVPSLVSSCGSLATEVYIAGALPKPKNGLFTGFSVKLPRLLKIETLNLRTNAKVQLHQ
jgi:hypothetical protein